MRPEVGRHAAHRSVRVLERDAFKDNVMNKDNSQLVVASASYFDRVLKHEALKKGAAAAIAGLLFAAASEALFPTNEP